MKRERQYTLVVAGIILLALVVALGLAVQRLRESHRTRAVPILMYHKIGAIANNAWWVPTGVFERQLRALRNQGYSTVLPDAIVNHHKAGQRLPPKSVMITFDDGYRDSLALAEPLLKKYGFRAVVYLITDTVAETPGTRRQYEGVDVLTWPEIKAMQQRGTFVFGGHSHRHQNLAVVDDPYPDIRECYLRLRRQGIRQPFSFCYPHGQYNARTIAAVKRAGFRSAMACEDRVALTGKAMNMLALPRVSVMGGEHEFHVNRLSARAAPGEIVLHVMHTGIPMEVSPRLVWSGATTNQDYLPAVEIKNADYEWRWPSPAHESNAVPVRLEIWDKHRLFMMWSQML
ncbi:MAG: polysaccharide deacetylase family protein [Kiritimatiellota bacterium]|nr:polysaccharide deacetylase family protein [Kiritimatiellota bacterium]